MNSRNPPPEEIVVHYVVVDKREAVEKLYRTGSWNRVLNFPTDCLACLDNQKGAHPLATLNWQVRGRFIERATITLQGGSDVLADELGDLIYFVFERRSSPQCLSEQPS
jgi:hypothetical protein